MVSIDDFTCEIDCTYKDEHYTVRDNGAVMRHARTGKRVRRDDDVWTFGKPNEKTGYMEIAGQRVHRIVAIAFHGVPPTKEHVVDHIDTNRRNNRPENLRWLTRLENVLNNPITRARIESVCGSIENFLANPSILRGYEHIDKNFSWMRAVSPEEARTSLKRFTEWAKNPTQPNGGKKGDWIFKDKPSTSVPTYPHSYPLKPSLKEKEIYKEGNIKSDELYEQNTIQSLTPNAVQVCWNIPSEFPSCPQTVIENPLAEYVSRLKNGETFCCNERYSSKVYDYALADDGKALWVMTHSENIKPWALAKVTYKDGVFYHFSEGTYFEENGARRHLILAQGLEWTGGEVFDDYC